MRGPSRAPIQPPPASIAHQIERLASLPPDGLRAAWRAEFRGAPPDGLWPDLLRRMLVWRLQEKALGGHDRATERLLDSYGRKGRGDWRLYQRLKPGAVLVREFNDVRHTVTVAPDGFVWQGRAYSSLSAIAKLITGGNWNGPRFFGLRESRPKSEAGEPRAA